MSAGEHLQGPRRALSGDLPSIMELADCVFMQGRTGIMADLFPRLFHNDNLNNLFVFSENGRVVSLVGMVERKARIVECGLHVACMGAVSTYEEYRGRGLASQLVHAAVDKARADGVDVMLISGDRTLYRRIGAMPVGRDLRCIAGVDVLDTLHNPRLQVRKAQHGDLAACSAAYDEKPARFVRPPEDWADRINSDTAAKGWHHLLIVEEDGAFRGYIAINRGPEWSTGEVAEFGGTPAAVAGALRSAGDMTTETSFKITLQQHDEALHALLSRAGATFAPVSVDGAWTIVNFTRLMEQLRPWIEQRLGTTAVQSLKYSEDEETCTLSMRGETLTLSRAEAVATIFGTPTDASPPPPFEDIFPVPTIAYGIGYV
jgi:predicted N-acetyltransferase YhbS